MIQQSQLQTLQDIKRKLNEIQEVAERIILVDLDKLEGEEGLKQLVEVRLEGIIHATISARLYVHKATSRTPKGE